MRPRFEVANPEPALNAVVFRLKPAGVPEDQADRLNTTVRNAMLMGGHANLAQTKVGGWLYLKMTLLNPRTTLGHIERILDRIEQIASALESA